MLDLLSQVHCVFTCAGPVCPVTVKLLTISAPLKEVVYQRFNVVASKGINNVTLFNVASYISLNTKT